MAAVPRSGGCAMRINLDIGQLTLDGLDLTATDRAVLRTAVGSELARLLSGDGSDHIGQRGRSVALVESDQLDLVPGSGPGDLGRRIARAVYGGLRQ